MRAGAHRGGHAAGLLLLVALARSEPLASEIAAPLTESEWLTRYLAVPTYDQPTWARHDYSSSSSAHLLLQRAAVLHQQGQLDQTVQILKSLLQRAEQQHHGEAYAALAKV